MEADRRPRSPESGPGTACPGWTTWSHVPPTPSPSLHRLRVEVEKTGVWVVRLLQSPVLLATVELVELILGVVGVRVQRLEPVELPDLPLDQPVRLSRSRTGHNQIGSIGTLAPNQSRNSTHRSIGTSTSCTTRSRGGRPCHFSM